MIDYALVDDELALLWMANMGCIDMHVWSSRADRPERPDWVMFDLDPSEDASFDDVVTVGEARQGHARPARARGLPKTSARAGSTCSSIARRHTFSEAREFAAIVAGALARIPGS